MKIRIAFAAAATLALAACGSAEKPAAEASQGANTAPAAPAASEPVAAASPAGPAAAPAKGDKPTKDFVIGKWGNDGDCAMAIDLKADGASDGPFGNWTYSDGVIGFADAPEMKITVTMVDDKTMDSKNAQGGVHKMTRCP